MISSVSQKTKEKITVIIVEDDKLHYMPLEIQLTKIITELGGSVDITIAKNKEEAKKYLDFSYYDLGFFDLNLPSSLEGIEILKSYKERVSYPVVLTSEKDLDVIENVSSLGCKSYISKPAKLDKTQRIVTQYLLDRNKTKIIDNLLSSYVTKDETTIKEISKIPSLILNNEPVYIYGPSGTGKEVVAQMIHKTVVGEKKPFISINSTEIPENLIESKLFGHKKGAFTGAVSDQEGLLSKANSGTIFFDEIGKMKISLQATLLRVLQEREFTPLGCTKKIKFTGKIITAGKENLNDLVSTGDMYEDFLERILGNSVYLRPLRERPDDIIAQFNHFMINHSSGQIVTIDDDVRKFLIEYPWYGNTRELKKAVNKWLSVPRTRIMLSDLQELKRRVKKDTSPHLSASLIKMIKGMGLKETISVLESEAIHYFLSQNNYEVMQTMHELKISNTKFYKHVDKKSLRRSS